MATTWDPSLVSDELLDLTRLLGEPSRDLAILAVESVQLSATSRMCARPAAASISFASFSAMIGSSS